MSDNGKNQTEQDVEIFILKSERDGARVSAGRWKAKAERLSDQMADQREEYAAELSSANWRITELRGNLAISEEISRQLEQWLTTMYWSYVAQASVSHEDFEALENWLISCQLIPDPAAEGTTPTSAKVAPF